MENPITKYSRREWRHSGDKTRTTPIARQALAAAGAAGTGRLAGGGECPGEINAPDGAPADRERSNACSAGWLTSQGLAVSGWSAARRSHHPSRWMRDLFIGAMRQLCEQLGTIDDAFELQDIRSHGALLRKAYYENRGDPRFRILLPGIPLEQLKENVMNYVQFENWSPSYERIAGERQGKGVKGSSQKNEMILDMFAMLHSRSTRLRTWMRRYFMPKSWLPRFREKI